MEDVQGSSVLGINNPRRELSGGNFPRWDLCRGQLPGGQLSLVGIFGWDCSGRTVQGGILLFPSIHWEASAVSEDET